MVPLALGVWIVAIVVVSAIFGGIVGRYGFKYLLHLILLGLVMWILMFMGGSWILQKML